ncbi:hypothetical protein [Rhodococcus koreensis]
MVSRPRVVGLIVPLTAIAVWQLLVSADVLDYEYLPAPREVADALADLVRTGELADDLAHTLGVALAAAVITLTVGARWVCSSGSFPHCGRT